MVIIDSFYHFHVFLFLFEDSSVVMCDTSLKSVLHKCGLHVSLNIKNPGLAISVRGLEFWMMCNSIFPFFTW